MRFTHKLHKLTSGQAWQSLQRHIELTLLARRPVFRIDSERFIRSIQNEQFERIRRRYAIPNPGNAWQKYLDLKKWIPVNLRRVRELQLDFGRPRRILDIGCGAGYFLYLCKWLGHDVLGLDIDVVPMYREMMRMLGLDRVLWRVKPFTPLPYLGERFDLITSFAICFNEHGRKSVWQTAEWEFFIDDLMPRLRPGGLIHLRLNKERNGSFFDEDLRRFFKARGAEIDKNKITLFRERPGRSWIITTRKRVGPKKTVAGELQPVLTKTHSAVPRLS